MIAYFTKRSSGEDFTQLSQPLSDGMWIHAEKISDNEINELVERYDLDQNIVADIHDRHELTRIEYAGNGSYIFLRLPRIAKSGHISALPLLAIIKDNAFLTLSTGESIDPASIGLSKLPITTEHTDTLLLGIIAHSVNQYEELIQHTSRSIEDTSNRLKTHEITSRDFIHFVTVEGNLRVCRMNLEGINAVASRLRENNHKLLDERSLEALDDIALHIQQLLVAVENHKQSVESIRNAYSTVANNALSQRMKTLTVFTVLITLPNVIYGMYGMNVVLPYANAPWAYGVIVGFTIVLIIGVYLIAKRLRIF